MGFLDGKPAHHTPGLLTHCPTMACGSSSEPLCVPATHTAGLPSGWVPAGLVSPIPSPTFVGAACPATSALRGA